MGKIIFTKEQQAEVLREIAGTYGKGGNHLQFDLWGNLNSGEIGYSEDRVIYTEFKNNSRYIHIIEVKYYTNDVYYVYKDGIESLIEINNLTDKIVNVE